MDINPIDKPELFSDESRQHVLYIILPALMALASAAVYLRLYTRAAILGLVGFDDWLCLAALTVIHAFGALALDHLLHHDHLVQSFHRIVQALLPRPILPHHELEDDAHPDLRCDHVCRYIAAAGNILADILILLLPLPIIKGLNLPRAQKLALGGIFCLGFLPPIPCNVTKLTHHHTIRSGPWPKPAPASSASASPTLRPLAIRWFPRVFLSLSRTIGSSNRAGGRGGGGGGGGSRHWQPKDLESTGGCGLRSATRARRSTKTWTNIDSGKDGRGDQDETMVARTDPGRSENRDDWTGAERNHTRSHSHSHNRSRNRDPDDDNDDAAPRPVQLPPRRNTFLDEASDSSVEIELRDVGANAASRSRSRSRSNDARISYPKGFYGGPDGKSRAIRQRTGNAVEISGGGSSGGGGGGGDGVESGN
ncbi:uncharacterized protein PG986_000528 [Apiospora aurea]|uniref:Rhodopsin domain-containing protein n=1 Tax=Apiospora aurea TaxID=335848 RepID=A0ABR1QU93_9PEZI